MHTLSSDESINLAKNKSICWAEKLNPCQANRISIAIVVSDTNAAAAVSGAFFVVFVIVSICWTQGGGNEKSHIVTRVHSHDLTSTHRPVKLTNLPTWVLNRQCCCINGLAVPHFAVLAFFFRSQNNILSINNEQEAMVEE